MGREGAGVYRPRVGNHAHLHQAVAAAGPATPYPAAEFGTTSTAQT